MPSESNWRSVKSETHENYLKTIYHLQASGIDPNVQELSTRLGVSPPAVSKMLRHLATHHLVVYTPYQPVSLTPLGEKVALEVVRHHRLLELYLVQNLGYGWDQVHEEAERLEHYISEEFEDTIDRLLGYPTVDPHGDPIPTRDGSVPRIVTVTLDCQENGACVVIRRVADEDPNLLRYLAERGIRPGTVLVVVDREPFGGSLRLNITGREERITPEASRYVFVEPASCGAGGPEN